MIFKTKESPFLPLTAQPFPSPCYRELPPCKPLLPFVRCFWESSAAREEKPALPSATRTDTEETRVIPDLCADIIITTDGDGMGERELSGAGFCGVSDALFFSRRAASPNRRLFGIRFYAWQATRFSSEALPQTANGFFDLHAHFERLAKKLLPRLSPHMTLPEFRATAEPILLSALDEAARSPRRFRQPDTLLLNAISCMIQTRGSLPLSKLLSDIHASERQLERLFAAHISLSPKKVSSLVRYQSLWQEVCRSPRFDVQDAVARYGYFDQSHLLHEFKRFHGISLGEAARNCRGICVGASE